MRNNRDLPLSPLDTQHHGNRKHKFPKWLTNFLVRRSLLYRVIFVRFKNKTYFVSKSQIQFGDVWSKYIGSCRWFLVLIPSIRIFSLVHNSPLSGLMLWTLWMIQMNIISIWQRESEKSRSEETHISKTMTQNKYQKLVHAPYHWKNACVVSCHFETYVLCHVFSKLMCSAMSFQNSCVVPSHTETHIL